MTNVDSRATQAKYLCIAAARALNASASIALLTAFICISFSSQAQWLEWNDETDTRLVLSTVANSDDEEKDIWVADFNNDGWDDAIVVRKAPFSNSNTPPKSDLLLMNINGVLTDMTTEYAPEFLSNPSFARDAYVDDFDGDGWPDIIIANTFNQQPMYFRNLGNVAGVWQGFVDESATRFPFLDEDTPLICAVWGGDLTGNGAKDLYFCNYKFNATGGIAQDFLLINDGTGHFTNESQARLGNLRNSAFGTAVQLHDIDQDGDLDVLKVSTLYNVAPWNSRGLLVLFNNGDGTFTNWQNLQQGDSPYMFEVADFDLDGWLDIYVVDDATDRMLYTTGATADNSVTFTQTNLGFSSTNGFGGNVHAADLNLDGYPDVAIADVDVDIPPCDSGRRLAIYQNDNGSITDPYGTSPQAWADNSYDFYFIDINRDGLLDFITGGCSGYSVFMSANCDIAPNSSDFDGDGLPDACDPCPNNPDPDCTPPTDFPTVSTDLSMARQWNELALASIRRDFARPTVHARNLFHHSIAMWDAWAAYDPASCNYLLGQNLNGYECTFDGIPSPDDLAAARDTAIAYASYRLLRHRFVNSPQAGLLYQSYDAHMDSLGFDINFSSVDYSGGSAAALGNYIAACVIGYGLTDNSNESNEYANVFYEPVNPPLNVDVPGNADLVDPNRWQPLTLALFIDQSGNLIPGETPDFLSPEWGQVHNFALAEEDLTPHTRDGNPYPVYHDPGAPPTLEMDGLGSSEDYKWSFLTTAIWSTHLDPSDGVLWDISPATLGNSGTLPTSFSEHPNFYDQFNGGTTKLGHPTNPVTGQAYAPNLVPRGDYARVLAEYWADGPDSETPPGHWFTIFNYVSDHPELERRFMGEGPELDPLEWDVKGYLAMGGAMHDAAVSAWGVKGYYDYIRPISAIRGMAEYGQSSLPGEDNYHPAGLPLIPDYIEIVQAGDPLAGPANVNVGKIKMKSWRGHTAINNVDTDIAGVGWILAENWEPYQRPSFVTPPFAGYVSGHSTFSRAAAELLTAFTGSAYFPGGLGEFVAPANDFLVFENGPSVDVVLQWATYQDAADESAASRIWGGIHPPADDVPGRLIGQEVGQDAFAKALTYFQTGACTAPEDCTAEALSVSSDCSYDPFTSTVEVISTFTFTMPSSYCTVDSLCYREAGSGSYTCIDLSAEQINSGESYSFAEFTSGLDYEVYFTLSAFAAGNQSSPIITHSSPDCSNEVPGCIDAVASNFDPLATLDDGSCTYACVSSPPVCVDLSSTAYESVISDLPSCCSGVWDSACQAAYDLLAGTCVAGCTDASACNFDPNADVNDGSCSYPGCTDPNACNYDLTAGCDDGTCSESATWYEDLDGDGYGTEANTFSAGCASPCTGEWVINIQSNGWLDETTWTFTDADGAAVANGGPYGNGGNITVTGLSSNGPFTFFIETQGQFNDNTPTWTVSTSAGLTLATGTMTGGTTLTEAGIDCLFASLAGDCDDNDPEMNPGIEDSNCDGMDDNCSGTADSDNVLGCTDVLACNYQSDADCDDGSCEYTSCLGCTDPLACNYDAGATQNDGSCDLVSCYGCTDVLACNYDPTALFDDGTCDLVSCYGCTDPEACNYDPSSSLDDGSCEYSSCVSCLGDYNLDGIIDITDMLVLLGQFACTNECSADLDGDGIITSNDMITLLSVFGTECP